MKNKEKAYLHGSERKNGGLERQVVHKDGEKEVILRKAQNTEMKISRRNNAQE